MKRMEKSLRNSSYLQINNWMDITWMGFSTNARYRSLMYVWTKQMTKTIMEKPDGYSRKLLKDWPKYEAKAEEINKSRTQEDLRSNHHLCAK